LPVADDPLVRMPGTQTTDGVTLDQLDTCDNCHAGYDAAVEPGANWRGSMMAQSMRDPIFYAALTVAAQDSIWAIGRPNATDICLRCHSPEGWTGGRSDPTNASALTGTDFDGVHCRFCHQLLDPFFEDTFLGVREGDDWPGYWDESNASGTPSLDAATATRNADITESGYLALWNGNSFLGVDHRPSIASYTEAGSGQYFATVADIRRGPFADAEANHALHYSRYHKSKYFCSSCHDVSNPVLENLAYANSTPGDGVTVLPTEEDPAYSYFHVERTFSEFMLSDFGLQGGAPGSGAFDPAIFDTSRPGNAIATCQDCHMNDAVGKGCNKNRAVLRPTESLEHPNSGVPVHSFAGGNAFVTWLLASAVQGSSNYDMVNRAMLNQGPAALTLDLSQGLGLDAGALLDASARAQVSLQNAASVEGVTYDPDTGALSFEVVNHTGHKLISGFPEGRRMFVNVQAYAGGNLLYELNPYDTDAGTLRGLAPAYSPNSPALGADEDYDDALVYEMRPSSTLTNETSTFHFVLADGRYKDNRIPPRGFRIAEADARECVPVWAGVEDPDYFSVDEYAGGYDQVDLVLPTGADTVYVWLYYQTISREYVEFLRDEISGTATTLDSPTPYGDPEAYIAQSDAFFDQLHAWGGVIWQLWDRNKNAPGAAPYPMALGMWIGTPCVPTGIEVCDDIDNDCNGLVDDGLPVADYWPDSDGDGFGDASAAPLSECAQPAGYVADNTDCDDHANAVHPGAAETTCDATDNDCDPTTLDDPDGDGDGAGVCTDCNDGESAMFPGNPEICDGLDNDCNGPVDDGLLFIDYWPDTDGDGYGDASGSPVNACAQPAGHVADNTDCNDADFDVNPGATETTCDSIDNDCDPATLDAPDGDDDGATVCTDCNDAEPAMFPGNPEICDGLDNDCNGNIDDGFIGDSYWPDTDGDNYGDENASPVTACAPPPNHVANNTDCNDAEPAMFPGNPEVCDDLDNDCNGSADDGLATADYWPDSDGDGFGDESGTAVADCAQPAGHVADHTDCNDDDFDVHPGATEITCDSVDNDCDPATLDDPDGDGDGVGVCSDCNDDEAAMFPGNTEICDGLDNDCNDSIDDGLPLEEYWPDADSDGFGDAEAEPVDACAAPPGHVANASDCDDDDLDVNPDADEVTCDGKDNDCDPSTADEVDLDSDGVGSCSDCNDSEATVYPGAEEICNDALDNDCDGNTDTDDTDCGATTNPNDDGGCGCRGGTGGGDPLLLILALGWLVRPRRQRRRPVR